MFDVNRSGARVQDGDWYQVRLPNGGGFGDQLDRDPELVFADVTDARYDADAAHEVYGVHITDAGILDAAATEVARAALRETRLARAEAPAKAVAPVGRGGGSEAPLYPGVVQRGNVAYAIASGAPLAVAPDHWTDGCPVLIESLWGDDGPEIELRTYLDPSTGRALHVEAAVTGSPRTFAVNPERWATARDLRTLRA